MVGLRGPMGTRQDPTRHSEAINRGANVAVKAIKKAFEKLLYGEPTQRGPKSNQDLTGMCSDGEPTWCEKRQASSQRKGRRDGRSNNKVRCVQPYKLRTIVVQKGIRIRGYSSTD